MGARAHSRPLTGGGARPRVGVRPARALTAGARAAGWLFGLFLWVVDTQAAWLEGAARQARELLGHDGRQQ
jgi:hypothetical protein